MIKSRGKKYIPWNCYLSLWEGMIFPGSQPNPFWGHVPMRRPTEPNGAAHNPGLLRSFMWRLVSSSSVKIVKRCKDHENFSFIVSVLNVLKWNQPIWLIGEGVNMFFQVFLEMLTSKNVFHMWNAWYLFSRKAMEFLCPKFWGHPHDIRTSRLLDLFECCFHLRAQRNLQISLSRLW